jgi:SAM-dependent methyltransferase
MIEHLVDPDTFVSECYRVLKDDGRFVIATCNLADIYSRLTFLFGYQPFMYNPSRLRIAVPFGRIDTYMGHKSVFTFRGLKDFLRNHGFGIEGSCGYSYAHDVYFGYDSNRRKREVGFYGIRKVLNRVSPKLAREGMLFICRKNNPLD